MPKFRVCLTRDTSEEASIVVEAANAVFAQLTIDHAELEWEEGDYAENTEVYDVTEVDESTRLGSYLSAEGAAKAHAAELVAALRACHDVLLMDSRHHYGRAHLLAQVALDKVEHAQGKTLEPVPTKRSL